jgi:hypothetical protein
MQNLLVLLAGLLLGWLIQYILLRRRVDRATAAPAQIQRIREEVDRMVVQMNQTTDRNVSLLEDRINQLMELLAKADKKMGLLRREEEKHEVGRSVYTHLVKNRGASSPPPPEPAAGAFRQPAASAVSRPSVGTQTPAPRFARDADGCGYTQAKPPSGMQTPSSGTSASPLAGTSGMPPAADLPVRPADAGGDLQPPQRVDRADWRQEIMRMHRSGFTPAVIARRLGLNLGEVELIISLAEGTR